MATATVNAKGQITIPVQVRATLGLQPRDEIEFVDLENGQLTIVAATYSVWSRCQSSSLQGGAASFYLARFVQDLKQ